MKKLTPSLLAALLAATSLVGCSDDSDDSADPADETTGGEISSETLSDAVATYSQIVRASYEDSIEAAETLDSSIDSFLADPTEDGLNDAREAWLAAREPYLQTEVYRFYGGPIDDDDGPEGLLNAWPLDEAYIDYVDGDETAGIVNDDGIDIVGADLVDLNEQGGDANIATGYHAIEFLLWGQDMDEAGPGDRPYTDYVVGGDGTAENQERRGEYLTVTSELLLQHLGEVNDEWAEGGDNFRADFESADSLDSIAQILTGMIILSGFETGGERLQPALDLGDQEEEHSCFSDNTHRDMIQDVQGVLNVYVGSYERLDGSTVSGTSIKDVVAEFDSDLADALEDKIRESLQLAQDMEVPFDAAIALDNESGREGVAALITSLREQESLLEDVFRGLELDIPVAE